MCIVVDRTLSGKPRVPRFNSDTVTRAKCFNWAKLNQLLRLAPIDNTSCGNRLRAKSLPLSPEVENSTADSGRKYYPRPNTDYTDPDHLARHLHPDLMAPEVYSLPFRGKPQHTKVIF
jgi:hypothetical protein